MSKIDQPKFTAYFAGACEPQNPGGTATYGAVVYKDDELIWSCSEIYRPELGHERETSNHVAEYLAFLALVSWFSEQALLQANITFKGHSQLVIEQMFGEAEIRQGLYVPLALKARAASARLKNSQGELVPKGQNEVAAGLCKAALERAGVKSKFKGKHVTQGRSPANDNEPFTGAIVKAAKPA